MKWNVEISKCLQASTHLWEKQFKFSGPDKVESMGCTIWSTWSTDFVVQDTVRINSSHSAYSHCNDLKHDIITLSFHLRTCLTISSYLYWNFCVQKLLCLKFFLSGKYFRALLSPAVFFNITRINLTQFRKLQKPILGQMFERLWWNKVNANIVLKYVKHSPIMKITIIFYRGWVFKPSSSTSSNVTPGTTSSSKTKLTWQESERLLRCKYFTVVNAPLIN